MIINEGQIIWLDFRGNIHQEKSEDLEDDGSTSPEPQTEDMREGQETTDTPKTPKESPPPNMLKEKSLRLAYNTHIRNKLSFLVTEIDKFSQRSLECYRGFVQVYTRGIINKSVPKEDDSRDTDSRSRSKNIPMKIIQVEGDVLLCELLVNLAKPENEILRPICRTPLNIAAGCGK